MHTAGLKVKPGFAIWITGLPSSGKSTLATALASDLSKKGIKLQVLESDSLRHVLTPRPRYDGEEREFFYGAMAYIGALLTKHGISVIFDATANRRDYRGRARQQIAQFIEVYVECPLEVCVARDPKGIYQKSREGVATKVPGIQTAYEPPEYPDVVVHGDTETPEVSVPRVVAKLIEKGYLKN
jgi:adenylylsulfate kinase